MSVTWDILTPAGSSGAVAIIQLSARSGASLDAALAGLGLGAPAVGRIARRTLLGIDDGLVARWSPTCAQLMPHGGPVVVRSIATALAGAGLARRSGAGDPLEDYPEASTEVEARMLAALALCASPRAIDLLLDQPRRWGQTPAGEPGVSDRALDRVRNRLLRPPLVVAIGPPNIGKSTLVNALAGRAVSLIADEPGTTRDHVGVELNLRGLVVHYVDSPGLEPPGHKPGAIQAEAQELARQAAGGADLVLVCGDVSCPDPRGLLSWVGSGAVPIVVCLRHDLGAPGWTFDVALGHLHSGGDARGLERLVDLIAETLVPAAALRDTTPWRFWD